MPTPQSSPPVPRTRRLDGEGMDEDATSAVTRTSDSTRPKGRAGASPRGTHRWFMKTITTAFAPQPGGRSDDADPARMPPAEQFSGIADTAADRPRMPDPPSQPAQADRRSEAPSRPSPSMRQRWRMAQHLARCRQRLHGLGTTGRRAAAAPLVGPVAKLAADLAVLYQDIKNGSAELQTISDVGRDLADIWSDTRLLCDAADARAARMRKSTEENPPKKEQNG